MAPPGLEGLNVGNLNIQASVDTSQVTAGLNQMNESLQRAEQSAKQTFSEMDRLGAAAGNIAGNMAKMGAAAGSALTGIAAMSPQAAPALAKMQTDFTRLTHIVGEQMAPSFNQAAEAFNQFVNQVDSNEGSISAFNDTLQGTIQGLQQLSSGGKKGQPGKDSSLLQKGASELGPEAIGGLLGLKVGGPLGAAVGFGGTGLFRGLTEETPGTGESAANVGKLGLSGGILGGAAAGASSGSVGGPAGAGIGLLAGLGLGLGKEMNEAGLNPMTSEGQFNWLSGNAFGGGMPGGSNVKLRTPIGGDTREDVAKLAGDPDKLTKEDWKRYTMKKTNGNSMVM